MKRFLAAALFSQAALAFAPWWDGAPDCAVRLPHTKLTVYLLDKNHPFTDNLTPSLARLLLLVVVLLHRLADPNRLLFRKPGRLRVLLSRSILLSHAHSRDLLQLAVLIALRAVVFLQLCGINWRLHCYRTRYVSCFLPHSQTKPNLINHHRNHRRSRYLAKPSKPLGRGP